MYAYNVIFIMLLSLLCCSWIRCWTI